MAGDSQQLFQVWRKAKDSRSGWHKVPGLGPLPHAAAFQARVEQEWIASYTEWEHAIVPVGQFPVDGGGQPGGVFYRGYRTKQMRPQE